MNAIEMMKTNDTGLLKLEQIEDFRAYLEANKCRTRKGNHAQLMHVHTSAGWAPIQKGAGGVVKSPVALRAVINDFLLNPVARSFALAKRINDSKTIPLNAPDLALQVAEAVAAKPANDPAPEYVPGCHSHVFTLQGDTNADRPLSGVQTCENGDHVHNPIGFRERLSELASGGQLHSDQLHLEDLRDDFAIHCPLTQRDGEDLRAFADRRWKYADVMMQVRHPQYAD